MRVLVTGATGYVGSRLVPRLLEAGHEVGVVSRSLERVTGRSWADAVTTHEADVRDRGAITAALTGYDVAVYLVHGLASGGDFERTERRSARIFASAARVADVGHVVYLGGLANAAEDELSPHLRSRLHTGAVLADEGPPTTELRASIVLGAGSASFELVRFAAESVPLLARPTWSRHRCQPVAIADLLEALASAVDEQPPRQHHVLEVGGPEALAYADLVHRYREVAGTYRMPTLDVPLLPPALAGLAASLVTPVPPEVVAPLVESLAYDTVVTDLDAARIGAIGVDEAMCLAIEGTGPAGHQPGDPAWVGRPHGVPESLLWWATRPAANAMRAPQVLSMTANTARRILGSALDPRRQRA